MSFTKHIGKHGDRKVAVVFREVPGEAHMSLVTYTETLNREIQDSLMRVIQSAPGQQANELAEILNRELGPDGRPLLEVLHSEGKIKKVNSNQVIMTPTPSNTVRLDELNDLINQLETGEEAVQRLAELDANQGLVDPTIKKRAQQVAQSAADLASSPESSLSDEGIANSLLDQASRMELEAKSLLAESKRLKAEAKDMMPAKRGRPKKTTANATK